MRITPQSMMNMAIRQAQARQAEIAKLQDQLATGLKISKPSDAPHQWSSLTRQREAVRRLDVELENIATVRQRLNESVSNLQEAGRILVRARELALDGYQSQHRETLAQEVDQLIDSMLQIANNSSVDLQLYGGTASHEDAFAVARNKRGRPQDISYVGASVDSRAIVSGLDAAPILYPGNRAFGQQTRSRTEYLGSTGASAGVGTDSATGTGKLIVDHSETIYASDFVRPGEGAPTGDTIIGPPGEHWLAIENLESGRVVSLNGGSDIPFDETSTNLKVEGFHGHVVFVDLSSVPSDFAGRVDLEARGTMSVDDGANRIPIDFSRSQLLTDSRSGEVTVVDSRQIRLSGQERLEYSGTNGVFESLIQLRDDLRSAEDWSSDEVAKVMDARLADVQRSHDQLMEFVGEQSVELTNLERLESRAREIRLVTQESVNETESADVAEVIVQLQTQQNHLQFIFASTASLNQASLLDFIS